MPSNLTFYNPIYSPFNVFSDAVHVPLQLFVNVLWSVTMTPCKSQYTVDNTLIFNYASPTEKQLEDLHLMHKNKRHQK